MEAAIRYVMIHCMAQFALVKVGISWLIVRFVKVLKLP